MSGRSLVLTCALAVMAGVPRSYAAQEPQDPPAAKFSSAVDVVSVTAIVRDRKGRFVRDLDLHDFTVIEAGETRKILDFRAESDGPVKLAMLFDVSGSMRLGSKAIDARQAARQVFSAMRPQDEAALYVFDSSLHRASAFTSDVAALDAALDKLDPPYGQTSLYDAVAGTARDVAKQEEHGSGPLPQRRAVVVLTDGVDTGSRLTPAMVSGIASEIDVPVYVVAVMSAIDDPREGTQPGDEELSSALGNLSRWTGGELFIASAPAHASIAARRIVDELRHQYVLAFEASTRPGWRPLEVRSRDREHIVRSRSGYTVGGDGAEEGRQPFGTASAVQGSKTKR
jgi:VWFA-related protein